MLKFFSCDIQVHDSVHVHVWYCFLLLVCMLSLSLSSYGVGYHMTVVKEPSCNSEDVVALVTQMVPGSEQITDVGAELSFILPTQAGGNFPRLFDVMDSKYIP